MVDVSFAKQPGVASVTAAELGKGPMIGVSPALNPKVTELLFETAQKEKNWRKNKKEDASRIMPLTDENKEKNAENLKKSEEER